jgi:Methyltransferase domain
MSTSSIKLGQLKRLVPAPLKRAAKEALLNRTFRNAIRHVADLPLRVVPSRELLSDLLVGWGNEGFAAQTDYLEEVSSQAAKTNGPILECGSGLTSVMLGLLAGRRGVQTWSLEHFAEWRTRVTTVLERFEIPNVQICAAPLRSFGEFEWYAAPLAEMPKEFQLVICDGPPGATAGGRYGLLPVLGQRLPAGSLILLDDATRPGEVEVLQRWASETQMRMSSPVGNSFAVITRG